MLCAAFSLISISAFQVPANKPSKKLQISTSSAGNNTLQKIIPSATAITEQSFVGC
jgi:hypothetical protein